MTYSQEIITAARQDRLVHECCQREMSEGEIVLALLRRHVAVSVELMRLKSIAPHKIVSPDGPVYIWHCPDELIPAT